MKVKVSGYQIRSALQRWTLRRDAAAASFMSALHSFEGDDKPSPRVVSDKIDEAENAIALLQVWQARYNLAVQVEIPGGLRMPLAHAVKQHGACERAFKRWSSASRPKKSKYAYMDPEKTERDKDVVVARRVVSFEEASAIAAEYQEQRAQFTQAISLGNGTVMDLEGFPSNLL